MECRVLFCFIDHDRWDAGGYICIEATATAEGPLICKDMMESLIAIELAD